VAAAGLAAIEVLYEENLVDARAASASTCSPA